MDSAAYVLQEVAGLDGDGGAEAGAIRVRVGRRQGLDLEDDELDDALDLLEERGLVVRVADRYVLSPTMRLRVPKGPNGAVTMSRQAWIRLCGSLGLVGDGA
jgi:hypothetical protein